MSSSLRLLTFGSAVLLSSVLTSGYGVALAAPSIEVPTREEPTREVPTRPTVDVVIAGLDEPSDAALITTLKRSLGGLEANVTFKKVATMSAREVVTVPKASSVAVTVWIDLGTSSAATVYVTEGRNVFTRRLELRAQRLDPVALDLLDVVVSSSVEAVLSGRPLGVTREEFARSLEPPAPVKTTVSVAPGPPPLPSAPKIAVSAAAFYESSLMGPTTFTQGLGLQVNARRGRFFLGLTWEAALPYDVTGSGATVHLASEDLRLSAGRIFSLRSRLTVMVGLGAGADFTHVRSISRQLDIAPAADSLATDFVIQPLAGLERRFGRLIVGVRGGIDIDPAGSVYVIKTAAGTRPVWTPWQFRPLLALAVGLDL